MQKNSDKGHVPAINITDKAVSKNVHTPVSFPMVAVMKVTKKLNDLIQLFQNGSRIYKSAAFELYSIQLLFLSS